MSALAELAKRCAALEIDNKALRESLKAWQDQCGRRTVQADRLYRENVELRTRVYIRAWPG